MQVTMHLCGEAALVILLCTMCGEVARAILICTVTTLGMQRMQGNKTNCYCTYQDHMRHFSTLYISRLLRLLLRCDFSVFQLFCTLGDGSHGNSNEELAMSDKQRAEKRSGFGSKEEGSRFNSKRRHQLRLRTDALGINRGSMGRSSQSGPLGSSAATGSTEGRRVDWGGSSAKAHRAASTLAASSSAVDDRPAQPIPEDAPSSEPLSTAESEWICNVQVGLEWCRDIGKIVAQRAATYDPSDLEYFAHIENNYQSESGAWVSVKDRDLYSNWDYRLQEWNHHFGVQVQIKGLVSGVLPIGYQRMNH